jgi:hypothetical protein
MISIIEGFEKCIKEAIQVYSDKISEKYDIDYEELQEIWNNLSFDIKLTSKNKETVKKSPVQKKENKTEKQNKKEKDGDDEADEDDRCPYVFTKGKNSGQSCNAKLKDGLTYCSKHQKCEGIGQAEKKKTPKTKESISSKAVGTTSKKSSPEKRPIEKIIKLNNDINKLWHAETELVFKSKDERVVIASYRDGSLNPLTDDDIELCEKYGFKYEREENITEEVLEEESKIQEKKEEKKTDKKKVEEKKDEEKKTDKKKVEDKKDDKKKTEKVEDKKKDDKKKVEKETKAEEKKDDKKKVDDKKLEKKSISSAIIENNIKAKDIENILDELQVGYDEEDNDMEDVVEEEEYEEEYDEEE